MPELTPKPLKLAMLIGITVACVGAAFLFFTRVPAVMNGQTPSLIGSVAWAAVASSGVVVYAVARLTAWWRNG